MHADKELVSEALSSPKYSTKRNRMWTYITTNSDYEVNIEAIKNSKPIQTVRSLTVNKDDEVLPCEFYFGFMNARKLCNHAKNCFMKDYQNRATNEPPYLRTVVKAARVMVSQGIGSRYMFIIERELLSSMRGDQYNLVIRNDPLRIITVHYGAFEIEKREKEQY